MTAGLLPLLLIIAGPVVPPILTEADPGLLLRWSALPLSPRAEAAAGAPALVQVSGPAVLRVRRAPRATGPVAAACRLTLRRRFGTAPMVAELTLPTTTSDDETVAALPAAAVETRRTGEQEPASTLVIEPTAACGRVALQAFLGTMEDDEGSSLRVLTALSELTDTRIAHLDDETLAAWLSAAHPHRWQQDAALAVGVGRLLERTAGGTPPERAHALVDALIARAARDAPPGPPKYLWHRSIEGKTHGTRIADDPEPSFAIPLGDALDLAVADDEALRVAVRLPCPGCPVGAVAGRLRVSIDDRPPVTVPVIASREGEWPDVTRAQSFVWPLPFGARHVTLAALDRSLLVRGAFVHRKRSLVAIAQPHVWDRLRAATTDAPADADPPGTPRPDNALAAMLLGDHSARARLASHLPTAPAPDLLGALLATETAESMPDPTAMAQALAQADRAVTAAVAPLDQAIARLIQKRATRAAILRDLDGGRVRQAQRRLLALGQQAPLTDEDAALLGAIEGLLPEGIGLVSSALATMDGLLSMRPLDRWLWQARMHVYATGTHWRRLATTFASTEAAFVDRVPEGAPVAPGRTLFSPLSTDGKPLEINLPRPLQGHLRPVASLVSMRQGDQPPSLVRLLVDGAPVARLPALTALDHFDLAMPPGRHQVSLGPGDFKGTVLCNFGTLAAPFQLRRYVDLRGGTVAFQVREIGPPALAALSIRLVGSAGTNLSEPIPVDVTMAGAPPIHLNILAGAQQPPVRGDVDPTLWSTAAVEATFPVPAGASAIAVTAAGPPGLRVLVNVSLRERRAPVDATLGEPPATPARVPGRPGTSAGRASAALPPMERALILAEIDEVLLARETLMSALNDLSVDRAQVPILSALWRQIDELQGAAGTTASRLPISPAVALTAEAADPDLLPAPLIALLGDRVALRDLSAAALRARAGGDLAGDLAILAAARAAEIADDPYRAAALRLDLARAHPAIPAVRRQAGAALLSIVPLPAPTAARAYLELFSASQLDPSDSVTMRLLRRANGRTRLRALPLADQSAGSFQMRASPADESTDNADALLAPRLPDFSNAAFLSHGRDLPLAFTLPRPTRVGLSALPLELRPNTAGAMRPPPITVTWSVDDGAPAQLACAPGDPCVAPFVPLGAGPHVIVARLSGGIRPAAWISIHSRHAAGSRIEAGIRPPASSVAIIYGQDCLAATPETPIKVKIQGPVLVKVELRRPAADPGGRVVHVRVRSVTADAAGTDAAGDVDRQIVLDAPPDPRVLGGAAGAVTQAQVAYVPLPKDATYAVELRTTAPLALARLSVREGTDEEDVAETAAFALSSSQAPPLVQPSGLARSPEIIVRDGDLAPGWNDLGSLGAWTSVTRASTNPQGAPIQHQTSLHLGVSYRRLIETLHTTGKIQLVGRANDHGDPSQDLSAEAFFMHPDFRAVRLQAYADVYTQPVLGRRASAGDVGLMLEPVLTLTSGLHLVSKLSTWWSARTLSQVSAAQLPLIDPDVYSTYAEAHPRGLFWEEGLEMEPFVNMVLYANARLTTNPSLSPTDPDHASVSAFARTLLGRTYAEVAERSTWFAADGHRLHASRHDTIFVRVFRTLWPSERHMIDLATTVAYDFATRSPEFLLSVGWEGSNGRRFVDHSPLEGEDFFFPQRGPGAGTAHSSVTP